MKQFKNVLLVAPLNAQLLSQAKSLLKTSQSKLTLMSVAPVLDESLVKTDSGKTVDLQKLLKSDLEEELAKHAKTLEGEDFRVRTVVTSGQPFIEVIRQVISKKHDVVIMLADGVTSVREQLFGTLSSHLMRKCPCPVWIIKPTRRKKLRSVFAAVDPDPANPNRNKLNVEILERALTIAQSHNAKLHVVHAWNSIGGDASRSRRWMTKAEIRIYVEQVAREHKRRLNQLLESSGDGSEIVHMIQGHPGTVISELVQREDADLLVMGTVCRTGIPGFFIGNTAEMILSQVDCSVLTVKPQEFESPVKPVKPVKPK
jgi:nucleotide-binding universal stress UspA family protein